MAEYISMKQVPGGTVTAVDDRILYDYAINSGIIYGCEISYLGNNMIHINAGYGIIKGGLFEIEDHTEYVDYSESAAGTNGQIYLHFDAAAEDKLTIVKETTNSLHPMRQDENANYDNGVYEIQLCTFRATTTGLTNVKQTFVLATMPVDVLDSLEAIMANTASGKAAGCLAIKELNSRTPFRFGIDTNGNYGYIKDGADTVTPFINYEMTTLWKNPNSATAFPSQTLSIPTISQYRFIILRIRGMTSNNVYQDTILDRDNPLQGWSNLYPGAYNYSRHVQAITSAGIVFGNGYNGGTANNSVAIPHEIFGMGKIPT